MEVLGYVSNRTAFVDLGTNELKYTMSGTHKEYVLDVYQFQYLLLNASRLVGQPIPESGKIADPDDPDVKCNYWWIPEPHIPTSAQRIGDIMDLLTYAYWAKDGVNGTALTFDPLAQLDAATMERLKLRAEVHGIPYTDETQADLRQKVIDAITQATSGWPYTIDNFSAQSAADLTRELQNILLGNSYATSGSITDNYWWQGSGFQADTHATLAQAAWIATVGFNGKTAPDAMDQIVDLDFITRRPTVADPGMAMRSNLSGSAYGSIDMFRSALTTAVKAAADADPTLTYDALAAMTNYQLQYLLLNNVFKSDAEVKAEVIVDGKDAYWWFTADKPPETGKKEEIFVDSAAWTAFLNAAIKYYEKTTPTATAFSAAGITVDDAYLKDTVMLRGPGGTELTAGEFFAGDGNDLLWQTMKALHTSSRKSEFIKTTRGRNAWVTRPTWEEFQYVLLHLNDAISGWTMPSTEDCKAEKENYDWMWQIVGKVEYERKPMDSAAWTAFLNAAIKYYEKTTPTATAFSAAGITVDDAYLKDTVMLRGPGGTELTAGEFFAGDGNDLLWQTMKALHTSSRKSEFIKTTRGRNAWVTRPTWEEFQYVLLHLNDAISGWTMPSTEECEAWATQENAPWAWQEKAAGASLLTMEEDPPVPLAPLPEDMEPEWPDIPIGPILDELPAEPLGDEVRIRYLMAGPMILPLSLRRTK